MSINELIQYIQSANINFLIGSGASRPYLSTLGSIEKWLTRLADDKGKGDDCYKIVEASIYKSFYESVIKPNFYPLETNVNFIQTKSAYANLLTVWNGILNKRYSRLLNKQVNLFTTNIDLMIEYAASGCGVELNDGFKGSVDRFYDESNFGRIINQTSLRFKYTAEIPVFNLLKIHGSINWTSDHTKFIKSDSYTYYTISDELNKIKDEAPFLSLSKEVGGKMVEKTYEELVAEAQEQDLHDGNVYDVFLEKYRKLIIVNPTKRKFELTVIDYHFYELMRMYANALETENSILFVTGFSFADEHIATITKRAADNNPTLQIFIFAYSEAEEKTLKQNLKIASTCINNNITIITPLKFKNDNLDTDGFNIEGDFFDLSTVGSVFNYIEKHIHE